MKARWSFLYLSTGSLPGQVAEWLERSNKKLRIFEL